MAVLKDLIVHGPSRFISAVGFTDLTANKIEANTVKAENGYFTKLKAKTATMDSVVVNELLDVHGELHTKSWSNSNIATVDGNFHIVPTITAATATGTITYSSGTYSMDVTGAFATNTLTVGNSTSVVAWTPGSSLIVSGEVQINNEWLPLGTLKCDLGGSANLATDATSKKIPLSNIKDSNGQVSGVLEIIREALNLSGTSSTLNFRNVKIAFYSRKNTKMYPIGILLTAQGTGSSKTFIDMYNGNNESSSTYGGLAMPVVRIGNLSGNSNVANNQPLPAVGGQTPTGWGIYTSNGYFSGTIAAEKGKIANFTINGTKLYSNGHSAFNTGVTGIYIGDDYISFGSGGVTYFNTSGTGKIGPWMLTTGAIYNGKTSNNVLVTNPVTNTTVAGVYLGTDGLNISGGTAATTAYITKSTVNIGNKLTWNGTTLSVNGAITATSLTVGSDATITDSSGKITNSTIYGNLDNFTILWNYENFSTANNGEGYICKYDPATGTKSDANGTVLWNGTKRTITKQMINPNTILPYNIPIYVVCRLSSATATTGTNYMVWYNSGWKYAVMPTPTAVGGTWTWAEATDIVLGKFVEPSSEAAFIECDTYNPPWSSKQVTSATTTAASAQALANTANINASNAAKTATNYLSFDSTNGLRIAQSTQDFTKPYVQVTSNGVKVIYNSTFFSNLTSSGLSIHAGNASNPVATFGSSIIFYEPGTTTQAATIDGTGINIKAGTITLGSNFSVTSAGAITAKSGTIGGWTINSSYGIYTNSKTSATSTNTGILIQKDGGIYAGAYNSTNGACPFQVTSAGALTAISGRIGKFNLSNTYLYTGSGTTQAGMGGDQAFWAGSSTSASAPFRVSYGGVLYATGATISGKITISDTTSNVYTKTAADSAFDAKGSAAVAETKATNYITASGDGILVRRSTSDNTNGVKINSDGVRIYRNSTYYTYISASGMNVYAGDATNSVASFGATARVGKASTAHINVLSNSLTFYSGTESTSTKLGEWSIISNYPTLKLVSTDYNTTLTSGGIFSYRNGKTASLNVSLGGPNLILGDNNFSDASDTNYKQVNLNNSFYVGSGKSNGTDAYATVYGENSEGVSVMVDGGGTNRGIYDESTGKWMIHFDQYDHTLLPEAASNTVSSSANVNITAAGTVRRHTSSSKRYKTDIEDLTDEMLDASKLYDVKVRQFKYKDDYLMSDDQRYGKTFVGFIVEELEEIYPIAIDYEDELPEDWNARYIIPPMLKLIQDQKKKINELEQRIETLERR